MTSSIVATPKRHFLAQKHVVWAIKRENRSTGSTWAQDREKKGQDRTVKKVTKALYFTYLGRSPHWTDFYKNLHSSCRPRRNHVCKLLSWNFQWLRFYRGSNFPFSYWFFHGPYNSAALLRCLWQHLYSALKSEDAEALHVCIIWSRRSKFMFMYFLNKAQDFYYSLSKFNTADRRAKYDYSIRLLTDSIIFHDNMLFL